MAKSKEELEALVERLKKEKAEYEEYVERQVTHLIGTISNVALGDFSVSAKYERKDDLGALAEGINMMIKELKSTYQKLEKALEEVKGAVEAEAKAAAVAVDTIEAMPIGVIVHDLEGKVLQANEASEKMFGYKKEEGTGKSVIDFIVEKDRPRAFESMLEGIREGYTRDFECTGVRKDGKKIPLLVDSTLMRDAEGNPSSVVIAFRDITELKRLQEKEKEAAVARMARETEQKRIDELEKTYKELRETQSWLIQVAKMAAVGQLAAGIAHEINNPLGIAYGFLEILKKEVKKPSAKKDVGNIKKALDRCKEIVRNLLDFSRPPVRGMEITNVNKSIKATLSLVSRQLKNKNIKLVERLAPDLPEVVAVPTQLQQVYMNLIFNAQDAMPKGGRLIISTERTEDGKFVEIIFKDSGKGIPKENIRKIFEPFFTTKPGVGIGLGLSISYGIIKAHKGVIEVQSRPEKTVPAGKEGSTFTIKLPVKKIKRRKIKKRRIKRKIRRRKIKRRKIKRRRKR